jgi:transcriptional regulator GlxA family with amidase domain
MRLIISTGKASLEFTCSTRLKRAGYLLAKSGMSIAEIAYEVSFNNPKRFH